MIKVTIYKNHEGKYKGFKTHGHAKYADKGYDIICAGVSVLTINTINSIDKFTSDKVDIKQDEAGALLEIEFLEDVSEQSSLLIDSMILGLKGIRDDNGNEYISIVIKEV